MPRDPFDTIRETNKRPQLAEESREDVGETRNEEDQVTPRSHIDDIPAAEWKSKKRFRSWDLDHPAKSYRGVPSELVEQINQVATEHHLRRRDDVVRAYLEYSLHLYDLGDLELDPQFNNGRLVLFTRSNKSGWQLPAWKITDKPVPPKKSKAKKNSPPARWKQVVSFRISHELVEKIGRIAYGKSDYDSRRDKPIVPIGEVITALLTKGHQDYQAGILVLNPQPSDALTLYPK
ncbi:MAG: hypothetical protein H8D34_33110 [Chloroflexi bacterium]|nr:hypothetical protein [Chloroflexota bacterium]